MGHQNKLEENILKIDEKKKTVIKAQKYEDAANLRDEERKLKQELENKTTEWLESINTERRVITSENVAEVVSKITGIPVNKINQSDLQKLRESNPKAAKRADDIYRELGL